MAKSDIYELALHIVDLEKELELLRKENVELKEQLREAKCGEITTESNISKS